MTLPAMAGLETIEYVAELAAALWAVAFVLNGIAEPILLRVVRTLQFLGIVPDPRGYTKDPEPPQ